jgi:hypothetical protein
MDRPLERPQKLPEDRGGTVAENRSITASKHGRHEVAMETKGAMAHCVDPAVDAMQLPFAHADRDRFRAKPHRFELRACNHAMLPCCDYRSPTIERVEFRIHMGA